MDSVGEWRRLCVSENVFISLDTLESFHDRDTVTTNNLNTEVQLDILAYNV
jgi:hypothetical protein